MQFATPLLCLSLLLLTPGLAAAQDQEKAKAKAQDQGTSEDEPKDIVERAYVSRDFLTLYKAIKEAGLVDTLKGEGPFTVLAPTDAAFAKLPKATRDALFEPENKEDLVRILKYHVIEGKLSGEEVAKLSGKTAKSVEGGEVPIELKGGAIHVGQARVVNPDIACTNGVIHAIDTVMAPPRK